MIRYRYIRIPVLYCVLSKKNACNTTGYIFYYIFYCTGPGTVQYGTGTVPVSYPVSYYIYYY